MSVPTVSLRSRITVLVATPVLLIAAWVGATYLGTRAEHRQADRVVEAVAQVQQAARIVHDGQAGLVDGDGSGLEELAAAEATFDRSVRAMLSAAGPVELRDAAISLVDALDTADTAALLQALAAGVDPGVDGDLDDAEVVRLSGVINSMDVVLDDLEVLGDDPGWEPSKAWESSFLAASGQVGTTVVGFRRAGTEQVLDADLVKRATDALHEAADAMVVETVERVEAGAVRAHERADRKLRISAATGLAAASMIVIAGRLVGRSIAGPVRSLAVAATEVRNGRLDVEPVGGRGPRELVVAGKAFDELVESLDMLRQQAVAIAESDLDDPVLRRRLPGPLGDTLELTVGRWREATVEAQSINALNDAIADSTVDAHLLLDENLQIVKVNPASEALFGRAAEDLLGHTVVDILDLGQSLPAMRELLSTGRMTGEVNFRRAGSEQLVMLVSAVRVDLDSSPVYAVIARDITDRKLLEDRLAYRADHDELTGLRNRASILHHLDLAMAEARRTDRQLGVLFVDLDGFKEVNDAHGHAAGDHVLRGVSHRLQSALGGFDAVGRLGGDEFVAVVEDIEDARALLGLAEQVRVSLARDFPWENRQLHVSASVGAALQDDESTAELLLNRADVATYHSKNTGKNRVTLFHAGLETERTRRIEVRARLAEAIRNDGLELFYQPILDARTGTLTKAEALVRWPQADRGSGSDSGRDSGRDSGCDSGLDYAAPGDFVSVAEETDLVLELDDWVLRAACRQIVEWQGAVWAPQIMAVNISARHLGNPRLVELVEDCIHSSGVDPGQLLLEVTESTEIADPVAALRNMELLKAMGLALALDDFGTGTASLTHVHGMPIDALKIDRSFVKDLPDAGAGVSIVRSVAALAGALGLATVAEGIETTAQLRAAQAMDCTYVQGFLFSEPVPVHDFDAVARSGSWTEQITGLDPGMSEPYPRPLAS